MGNAYPRWFYYPSRDRPPAWVQLFVEVVAAAASNIRSERVEGLTSDAVLAELRPGLESLGFRVESGKRRQDRISLPVLFGEEGQPRVSYHVDAVHDHLGVLVEVEEGRGARSNSVYRDLVRASLIIDARFLALGVMDEYRHSSGGRAVTVRSYNEATKILNAIYASQRLRLPFEGVLLFGY